ncbi:MAG: ATP-binding cassette domain-containing protein [Candidatus Paceibacterota bacterium]
MENIIEVRNLFKSFKDKKAVDDISFDIKKGSIVAFLGPNGAGKSTTIKMLTTLLNPDAGKITISGHDIKESDAVRKCIGIVFQDPSVDEDLTAYENLEFHGVLYGIPKTERKERIKNSMDLIGLSDRQNDLVKTFSGGMKRRLEIGRGLIHYPAILFLDEPTTGLDPQTTNKIWEYIKKINREKGITVFLTTHYMPEAENVADEVIIIDQGKIMMQDTVTGILERTGAKNLEEAYLNITGKEIRQESAEKRPHFRH